LTLSLFQIDPSRIKPGQDVHANFANLQKHCDNFLTILIRTQEIPG
jgi:hypothetical protein